MAVLCFLLQCAGAGVAITNRLAYEFLGRGAPNRVALDFVWIGTALSGPLLALLALALFLACLSRRDGFGLAATIGITCLGFVFAVSALMEPIAWRILASGRYGSLEIGIVLLQFLNALAALVMMALGASEGWRRLRGR